MGDWDASADSTSVAGGGVGGRLWVVYEMFRVSKVIDFCAEVVAMLRGEEEEQLAKVAC